LITTRHTLFWFIPGRFMHDSSVQCITNPLTLNPQQYSLYIILQCKAKKRLADLQL
jgi:hypothetical protein